MTQGTNVQRRFGGGELSDELDERSDIDQYDSSIGPSLNVMSTNKGDLINRPGTEKVITQIAGKKTLIIPFIFSNNESFRLEFTDLKLRIYQGSTQISSTTKWSWLDEDYGVPSFDVNHYVGARRPDTFPYQVGEQFTIGTDSGQTIDIRYDPGDLDADVTTFEIKSIEQTLYPATYARDHYVRDDVRIQEAGQTTELNLKNTSTVPDEIYWQFDKTEWDSPYTEADLENIQYDGAGDIMFFVDGVHQPMKLSRVGDTDFRFHPHKTLGGPWRPDDTYDHWWDVLYQAPFTSVYFPGGEVRFTPSKTGGTYIDPTLLVGRRIRMTDHPSETKYHTFYWDGAIVSVNQTNDYLDNFDAQIWREAKDAQPSNPVPPGYLPGNETAAREPCDTIRIGHLFEEPLSDGTGGWPQAVTIWENRLIYGGSAEFPTTLAASAVGDFDMFQPDDLGTGGDNNADIAAGVDYELDSPETNALDSFVYSLQEGDASEILWLKGTPRGLMAGTENAILVSSRSDASQGTSATNFDMVTASEEGAARIQPLFIDGRVYYVNDKRNRVYSLGYSSEAEVYQPVWESIFGDHLLEGEIENLAFARDPIQVIWLSLSTGDLISMVLLKEQNQVGLFRHRIAGQSKNSHVFSMCVLPNNDTPKFDQLYLAVDRQGDGEYIERLTRYPIGIDMATYNGLDMADSPTTYPITAVSRTISDMTITVTGNPIIATEEFALAGFTGDLEYLNGQTLYTATSVATDDITFTAPTPPGGATSSQPHFSGNGWLYQRDAQVTDAEAYYDDANLVVKEMGVTLTRDTHYSDSGTAANLDFDDTDTGFIYIIGYAPETYIQTLPNVQNNQLGQASGYLSNISQVTLNLKETRSVQVKRTDGTLQIDAFDVTADTVGEPSVLTDGKYHILPEQLSGDLDGSLTLLPSEGDPFRLKAIFKRGERSTR